jgi:hypothetical protein
VSSSEAQSAEGRAENVPDAVRELRSDAARTFFSGKSMYGSDVKLEEAPFDAPAELKEAIDAYNAEVLQIYQDLELSTAEARQVTDLFRTHTAMPADDVTQAQWLAAAREQMQRQYGKDAPKALELATALARRDERVRSLLHVTGLGNHPKIVELFAAKARSQRASGKLK